MTDKPPFLTRRVDNYLQQSHAAFQDMLRYERDLVDKGWIFDPLLNRWIHPDFPHVEIVP
jgi:hypothetical protein